jgi:hypothetical protein
MSKLLIAIGIRVILDTCTWKFPAISYFSDLRQTRCARKNPKPVLETTLITKETTLIIWMLGKVLLHLFVVTQLGHFQCF